MLVPQLLAKTTQTFTLTVRIEEPETIDGHRWNKTVSVVTGIAGIEPTVEYTRWDGDRVKSMNASQTMQVSRSRDLDIGGSFETLEGGHCDVLDQVDVPLEKATYRDAWQLDCKNPEASSTMYVLDDGSLIRAVVKHKNDVVVEMRLAERGNANAR